MQIPILVPDLDSGDEPIRLCSWLIEEGDLVLAGDLIAELLIPGVTIELAADSTGRLVSIAKRIDTIVQVRDILGWLEDEPSTDCPETRDDRESDC